MAPRGSIKKRSGDESGEIKTGADDQKANPKRDERRAQLVQAAREIFGEKGYHESTVDDITRRAGVAKGTFYLYFSEKKEVYYDLVRSFFQRIVDVAAATPVGVTNGEELYQRYAIGAMKMFQTFAEHHQLARLVYRESASLDPNVEKMLHEFYQKIAHLEAENVRLGQRLGVMGNVDPMVAAYSHIGMVERTALGLLREPNAPPPEVVVKELLKLAYFGLRPRSAK
jgi:AcrR family transcriptional regulator